jgi:exonuclease VII large subunit
METPPRTPSGPATSTQTPSAAAAPQTPRTPQDDAASCSVDQLRAHVTSLTAELNRERHRREAAERAMAGLRADSARTAMELEEEEEKITNKLMKRLTELKQEKEKLARQSESEEEFLTNTLQLRLEELQRQKHSIIASAEAEQEFIVNRLQRQLDELKVEKSALERRVQSLSRSTTPAGGGTPTSSPATSMRSSEGLLSRGGSLSLPPSGS